MGKLLLIIGLAGLCHAAYSATQHRNYLRLTEHEVTSTLPADVLVQCVLSLLLCCFGIVSIAAKFKPIQITSEWENKTWENIANRTSFYSFNHRGKYLFSTEEVFDATEYEPQQKAEEEPSSENNSDESNSEFEHVKLKKRQIDTNSESE